MPGAFGLSDLIYLALALSAAGLLTGFLAGLLGVGGGAILVPVLYELFTYLKVDESVRMHMVLGTSLAVIVPTALRSFQGHFKRGAVDMDIWRRLAPWVAAGVVLGVLTAKGASAVALKWVWVIAGSLIAAKMAFGREDWKIAARLPAGKGVEVMALLIGVVSALMSIGGGMFIVAADAVRDADIAGSRDLVWLWPGDLHSRCTRLYVGRLWRARTAAVFDRLCQFACGRRRHSDQYARRAVGRAHRARVIEAPARDRVRGLSRLRRRAVFVELGRIENRAAVRRPGLLSF